MGCSGEGGRVWCVGGGRESMGCSGEGGRVWGVVGKECGV